jgi:macrolide-specific efflux system membrane fusion protein
MNMQQHMRTQSPRAETGSLTSRLGHARGFLRRNRILVVAAFAVVAAWGGYSLLIGGGGEDEDEIELAEVTIGDIEDVVPSAGNLQPVNFVDVGAQVSGQLQVLHVGAGDEVSEGDLLAEIDATVQASSVESIRAQLMALQAQLEDRQAQLQLARIQAEREERLMAENATTQAASDSAVAALTSARAQLRGTEAEIQQTRSELQGEEALLGYSRIYAPISGTVSSIVAMEGQTLNANQSAPTILQIADLSKMTVSTQVSEADVSRLRVGMPAYFTTLGGGNRRWEGTLHQVLPTPQVVENVVLYTALFEVDNPGRELMTQMTAQVFFVIGAAYDTLRVPVAAVRYERRERSGGGDGVTGGEVNRSPQPGAEFGEGRGRPATVTVVSANGEFEERPVLIGVADRIWAEVVSGLEEGEQVVVVAEGGGDGGNINRGGGDWQQRRFGSPFGGLP